MPRTRALVAAAAALFGEGDAPSRRQRHAEAMAAAYAAHPDDPDIGARFYALAVLRTTTRICAGGSEAHEGHRPSLAGSPEQARAAGVLAGVLAAHPRHPGALHYLLHAYDDPAHARLALDAARVYATVAPQSSHALHCRRTSSCSSGSGPTPGVKSHAFAASEASVERRGLAPASELSLAGLAAFGAAAARTGHRGRRYLALIEPVVQATGDLDPADRPGVDARPAVVETGQWARLAQERNFANVNELCAIGFSAAAGGHGAGGAGPRRARRSKGRAAGRGTAPGDRDHGAPGRRLIALAGGRGAEAVQILRAAVRDELAPAAAVRPAIPIIPAPELLGEVLLELQQPAEALECVRASAGPQRQSHAVGAGSARAAARLGQAEASRRHYEASSANYSNADADLPGAGRSPRRARRIRRGADWHGAPAGHYADGRRHRRPRRRRLRLLLAVRRWHRSGHRRRVRARQSAARYIPPETRQAPLAVQRERDGPKAAPFPVCVSSR